MLSILTASPAWGQTDVCFGTQSNSSNQKRHILTCLGSVRCLLMAEHGLSLQATPETASWRTCLGSGRCLLMAEKHRKGPRLNRPPWCPPLVRAAISLRARDSNCLQETNGQVRQGVRPSLRARSNWTQASALQKAQASPQSRAPQRVPMAALLGLRPIPTPHKGQPERKRPFPVPHKGQAEWEPVPCSTSAPDARPAL